MLLSLIALVSALGVPSPRSVAAQSGIIYVRAGATAPGDGMSWATAYPSLQSALLAAASGAEVWVAAGRYTPAPASGNRAATFQLKNGVAIYGGFAGTETARSQRNWADNVVILSGDLNGNDSPNFANNSENSYPRCHRRDRRNPRWRHDFGWQCQCQRARNECRRRDGQLQQQSDA